MKRTTLTALSLPCLFAAQPAKSTINGYVYLNCKENTTEQSSLFDNILRVSNSSVAYWNENKNVFVDHCGGILECQTNVDDLTVLHLSVDRNGASNRPVLTTLYISRYTGKYSKWLSYTDAPSELPFGHQNGSCTSVASPEKWKRQF